MLDLETLPEIAVPAQTDSPVDLSWTIPIGKQKRFAANVAHMRRVCPPMTANRGKISRNGPCPCNVLGPNGQPRKFKHCCLALTKVTFEEPNEDHVPESGGDSTTPPAPGLGVAGDVRG